MYHCDGTTTRSEMDRPLHLCMFAACWCASTTFATVPRMTHSADDLLARIARDRLGLDALTPTGREDRQMRGMQLPDLRDALRDAYFAGFKVGIARELGITSVVHARDLDRFPWQVHVEGGHCHLFAEEFTNHSRIRSSPTPEDDREHAVSLDTVPMELLDAVRAACRKDRRR